ncbi:unnamed protein product [Phytophthora fragariaefolia]|uniref:Unnamed protein product n=1 Tax=Phytophthora fragariaefolia TaxID=1490495 RepID=A0A9W6XKX7_9STRA|nr:unnamed protein product [Phytophthora fragariaefolia]
MEQIVGPLLYKKVLVWLDDVLGFAKSPEGLLDVLEAFLQRCEQFGLKLHPRKCHFFMQKASWCGNVISADGVAHSPERVQGLVEMASPRTAGNLQHFLCAVGWMRQNIPQLTALTSDLHVLLDIAAKSVGSRKKTKLEFVLSDGPPHMTLPFSTSNKRFWI